MPIAISDLLLFNNVESTDPIVGAVELPYFKTPAFVYGISMNNGYDTYVRGVNGGQGSQVLVRRLGKGTATAVKATASGALDYSHAQTADTLVSIPLDDVIKQSEKVYEAVELARQSATGTKKAEIVLNNILDKAQELISGYLVAGATQSAEGAIANAAALKTFLISEFANLEITPDTLLVTRTTLGLLLQLTTGDGWVANPSETVMRTGIVGTILGCNVRLDENLDDETYAYVMYNHNYFNVFTVLQNLTAVPATDFDGSYVRGMILQGGYAPTRTAGQGTWAIAHVIDDGQA